MKQLVNNTIDSLKTQYFADERPWVVTYSGGKDSTTVLQLVLTMLQQLHDEKKDHKHTYIVSSDTGVEMPIIERYLDTKIDEIARYAETSRLNISCHKLSPKKEESFWSLLLGKGYPAPTSSFRWCTERLKINPATHFLKGLVHKHQSILMLLGVRSAESQARQASIAGRELNYRGLSPHDNIPNAFVLSPIKHWTNEDVWTYLSENPLPWGDHSYMMSLYDKGSGEGDCNIALNPEAPSCGKTRFGCWVCTVVEKDRSMEGMLKNGEEWMRPLWTYREKLFVYRNDLTRRDSRRRDGTIGTGPFLMPIRRELFEDLLRIEIELANNYHTQKLSSPDYNPEARFELISDGEIELIQENWNADGDISNHAYRIAQDFGRMTDRPVNTPLRSHLERYASEINIDLFERIYEIEAYRKNISNRYGITTDLEKRVVDYYKGLFREAH